MKKQKNTITDFYIPGVSPELKFCFQKAPIPAKRLEFSVTSHNEMINQIPTGIIDGWIWNESYMKWLELFGISHLDNSSILVYLKSYNKETLKDSKEEIKTTQDYQLFHHEDLLLSSINTETRETVVKLFHKF